MRTVLAAAIATIFLAGPAIAQPGGGMNACRGDVKTLCASAMGDRQAMRQCLMTNRDKVSEGCKTAMATMAERQAGGACKTDVATHCKGVERGGGRVMECLKANEAKLSAGCKAQMGKMKPA